MRSEVNRRIPALATAIATIALVLAGRLMWLGTVSDAQAHAAVALEELPGARGSLWDRNGQLVATETYAFEVGVAPYAVDDPARFALTVAPLVGRSAPEMVGLLTDRTQRWLVLDRGAALESAQRLRAANLNGLFLTPLPSRSYPLGAAAAHLTGFVNLDGEAHYGVEAHYDDTLRGRDGRIVGALGTEPDGFRAPTRGTDIVLTISRELQHAAATTLADAVAEQEATSGSVVVLDPRSGDVLAMTSVPSFDPNDYGHADPASFRDPVVREHYEPGSVIKTMTMAAALDSGVVGVDSTYEDPGFVEYGGAYITNWDQSIKGIVSMTDLMQHSLNVGAVKLAARMGAEAFYEHLADFGFGAATGLDIDGEVSGRMRTPADDDWTAADLATNAFGQGMAATPIQVTAAMGAIANGGELVPPRLVRARIPPGGVPEPVPPRPARRVVSARVAADVRSMLRVAVEDYAVQADVPGHSVAGKTGTSQIPIRGGYDPDATITTFVGFLPADEPQIVVLVKLDRPRHELAADSAAPVFRAVAARAARILNIDPDQPEELAAGS